MSSVVQLFYLLPANSATAAENMAVDWLMLESFPQAQSPRLRFYDWSQPAFTFGYGQKWAEVRAASEPKADLIRRPTGGGLVDHRNDWTYSLVLPAAHPLAQVRACESYHVVHEALAKSLNSEGVACQLQIAGCKSAKGNLSVCFQKAETFDIVRVDNGQKIAGAAQKRTRQGLLFQGSVDRSAAAEVRDWKKLAGNFSRQLATALSCQIENWRRKNWADAVLPETTARYAANDWNGKR